MNNWSVLDRSDPAPGDVAGTRALGESLLRQASDVEAQTARLRTLADDRGTLQMTGDYAMPYAEALEVLPGDLSKLGLAYHRCGTALTAFAQALSEAKSRAGSALRSGQDADLRYRAAVRQLRLLLPPTASLTLGVGTSLNPMNIEAASVGLDAGTQAQVQVAVRQAQKADDDLVQARYLADQAASVRNDAEETCVRQIDDALDESGLKNKSWLHEELQEVGGEFTWNNFIKASRTCALVAGVLAIVLTGPVGMALAITALVGSSAVFADGMVKYARGQIGIGDLAFDGLELIPAGSGFVDTARLIRMAAVVRDGISDSAEAATLTGRVARVAQKAEKVATGRSPQTLEKIQEWLGEVNPGYTRFGPRGSNCGECTRAVWRRLNGDEAVAGLHTYSTSQMEAITGVKQIRMAPSQIAAALKSRGTGSMAVVGIDRADNFGHWFNAYYDGKQVVAIDGQSGKILDWPPDFSEPGSPVTNWDAGIL